MELHRLDGLPVSGLDNVDIQDIDIEGLNLEGLNEEEQLDVLSGLGYVKDPEIAYEILDEDGNVVMYADVEENLYVLDGLGELGFFKKIGRGFKKLGKFMKKKVIRPAGKAFKTFGKKVVKPVVRTFNRFLNPATILLRNGFLLAMKINMMKVAEKLRFGYLSDAEARRRGMNPNGFAKVKKAVSKAEKIYKTAGGKASNLRKAILTGKGNKDKAVPLSGVELGYLGMAEDVEYMDPFEQFVIEADAEEVEAMMNGYMEMEGLGAVATGTALAAATSAVAAVASVLNKITGVFDKAKKTKDNVTNVVNQGKSLVSTAKSLVSRPSSSSSTRLPLRLPSPPSPPRPIRTSLPVRVSTPKRSTTPVKKAVPKTVQKIAAKKPATSTRMQDTQTTTSNDPPKESWAKKNKILLIGTGVLLAGGGITYAVVQSRKKKQPKAALNGVPQKKKATKIKSKTKKALAPKALIG